MVPWKKYIKCIGYSKLESWKKSIFYPNSTERGSRHGIMRCIYAKAQTALKRLQYDYFMYYKSFFRTHAILSRFWKEKYI